MHGFGGPRGMGRGRRRSEGDGDRPVSIREPLPDDLAALVAAAGLEARISVAADIARDGQLGKRWLLADPSRVLVVGTTGGSPSIELDVAVADLQAVRIDSLVGNQALVAVREGDDLELVRFTNATARRFAKVRRRLDDWRQGEELDAVEEAVDAEQTCPKCKLPIPPDAKSCPRCVNKRQALGRLTKYLRPHTFKVVAVSLLVIAGSVLELLQPQLNGLFFDRVLGGGANQHGGGAGGAVAWLFSAQTPVQWLLQIVLAMLLFRISGVVLGVFQGRLSAWLGYWVVHDIRAELYRHLQSLNIAYFDKKQTGAIMSRVTQDTRAMQGFLIDGTQHLGDNLIRLVLITIILLQQDWRLALLTMLPAPLILVLASRFFRRLRRLYGRLWQRWEVLTAQLQDSLSGVRVVKAFAGERREIERFNRGSGALADAGTVANQLRATVFPWLMFAVQLGTLVVWLYGGYQVIGNRMTTGQIMQFLSYLFMFYGPMQWISQLFNWFNETLAAAERVWEVLDEKPTVPESGDPIRLEAVAGRFVFDHVTFGYEPHEPVLKDICLEVEPGEMIGLVGHSGAGKSTLINLVCRFYDVDEGRLLVDGHDVRQIHTGDYRRHIGVVLQESFLFNGSIYQNIAYSRPDATLDEVLMAARAANAHDFILNFPDGYDTIVGERGYRLSGGERQRISIARAILHNPRILILDEATASVDTETERSIQEALTRLTRGRTVFAIAHRLSTLRNAHRLVVIEKGKIVEVGTHDELLAKPGGVFKRLVEMQTALHRVSYVGG
ncbi:MAG: ATP-binding cassette domain-containing protein [Fimbriimonadaceae bacterium]|nr:ATP-binding cassette domain-containing protein [Fimbriimonadaceae bacterium]